VSLTYPGRGEFFDLGDLRVCDDVMKYDDLWVKVDRLLLDWPDVEDGSVTTVAADQLGAIRFAQLHIITNTFTHTHATMYSN